MNTFKPKLNDSRGFTLLEIAVVMVIIGILAGGGVSLMTMLTQRKARNESIAYLQQSREALISFAQSNGQLPWADTDGDGIENAGATTGSLPYFTLQIGPTDPYKRTLAYAINSDLGSNLPSTCTALRAGLSTNPQVVDADGSTTAFSVAAVLISAGPMDADTNGNVFDDITAGTHQGDNTDGTPNFLRHPPVSGFDDLLVYIGGNQLYGDLCEYLSLAVNNNAGSTVYVHDVNQGSDLGTITSGNSSLFNILSGTRIELRSGPGGTGSILASTPPTPAVLAGRGATLNLP